MKNCYLKPSMRVHNCESRKDLCCVSGPGPHHPHHPPGPPGPPPPPPPGPPGPFHPFSDEGESE